MTCPRTFRLSLLSLIVFSFSTWAVADRESEALDEAINALDHYMRAGVSNDARRGAGLLAAFEVNARRAEYDTRALYRREQDLLSRYVSISSDLYGYQFEEGMLGKSVELEGGIETLTGVTAEFKARVVFRKKRWRIADLEID